MAEDENINKVQISCNHCDVSYWVKWEDDDHEPTTCPFCGADTSIDEEDADFEEDIKDEDDWN